MVVSPYYAAPKVYIRGIFLVMASAADRRFMKLALELAEKGRGQTSPNPMVGAVIVRDGEVVGEGYHEQAGLPHAELNALEYARDKAHGATLYVSLEPCCHSGRTPPCTKAIIEGGIKRVVCAIEDPNPNVSGNGIEELGRAGIEVDIGLMAEEARRLNEVYFKYITTGLPFVTLKVAQTIDGRIAATDGSSRWVSERESRRYVHRLRSYNDAVMVGVNTVIADDPELTVRWAEGRNPVRIVLDSSLRIPLRSKLLNGRPRAKTIIATSSRADPSRVAQLQEKGVDIWSVPTNENGRLSLQALLKRAGQEEITSILVEGGSEVYSDFIRSSLADKMHIFIAPTILGSGLSSIQDLGIESLDDGLRLREVEVRRFGGDVLLTGYFN